MNGLRLFADTDVLRVRHRTGYKYGGMYMGFVTFTGAGPIEVVANAPSFSPEGSVLLGSDGKKRVFLSNHGQRYRKNHQP